jgi:hypothetical protein
MERKNKKKRRSLRPTWALGIIISDPLNNGKGVGRVVKFSRKMLRESIIKVEKGNNRMYLDPALNEIAKMQRNEKKR